MIVLDASAFVDAALGNATLAGRLVGGDVHGPHLIDLVVAGALRRLVAASRIEEDRAEAVLRALSLARIHRHPHTPLLPLIWSLRSTVTPYDAVYVALSAALGAPLVTTDRKLASTPGLPCTVEAF